MLTEGWDANTVTHILGVRAFGTQLLCEQVVGRSLRRYSYDLSDGLFAVEYADIMGIPFNFTAKPQVAPVKPPRRTTRVHAVRERSALEITFPRVTGYRVEFPKHNLKAKFTDDSKLVVTPDDVGPGQTLMAGIVGEDAMISAAQAQAKRASTIAYDLSVHLLLKYFRDEDQQPKMYLFGDIKRIARQWINGGYLECRGNTGKWMLEYRDIADRAGERIYNAITNAMPDKSNICAVLDPYNPKSSTAHVSFSTSKDLYATAPDKCHVNYVTLDSSWEAEFARIVEQHPRVISYVKNQGLVGVNNLGSFGRWDYAEMSDIYAMGDDLSEKIMANFTEIMNDQVRKWGTEAARWLASAGGSEPDAEYIPRRRSEPVQ